MSGYSCTANATGCVDLAAGLQHFGMLGPKAFWLQGCVTLVIFFLSLSDTVHAVVWLQGLTSAALLGQNLVFGSVNRRVGTNLHSNDSVKSNKQRRMTMACCHLLARTPGASQVS